MTGGAPPATTRDGFFGGRLVLEQLASGHRAGTDAVLLAAAVPRDFAGLVLDVGAGAGAAGLGVALAVPGAHVCLVERDPVTAALAAGNIAANALGGRAGVVVCDILAAAARRTALSTPAALVLTNPPFYDPRQARASPVAARRVAHVRDAGTSLADWLRACLDLLAAKGTLIVVLPPAALPEALVAVQPGAGGLAVKGIHPRSETPARRILLRAVKGSKAPFAIAPPLVLHEGSAFTAEAERLHRGEAALMW